MATHGILIHELALIPNRDGRFGGRELTRRTSRELRAGTVGTALLLRAATGVHYRGSLSAASVSLPARVCS